MLYNASWPGPPGALSVPGSAAEVLDVGREVDVSEYHFQTVVDEAP